MMGRLRYDESNSTDTAQKPSIAFPILSGSSDVIIRNARCSVQTKIITIDQNRMQSTLTPTNLTNPQPPITQSINYPRPQPVLPLKSEQYVPPLQLNRQQGLAFQSSYTPRPLSSNEHAISTDPQVSQSQIVQRSATAKYGNKYSFKRNSTTRAKALSFRNTTDATNAVAFQESILGSVRSLAATRRGQIKDASRSKEGVMLWNTLTEMYNLTLAGTSSQLAPLQPITLSQQNRTQFPNEQLPQQVNFNKAVRPSEFLQSNQGQERERVRSMLPATSRSQHANKDELFSMDLPNLPVNNSNELYTLQIRELRGKIQALEHERSYLIERIQSTQSSEQDMQHYRSEINALRNQMAQLQAYSHQGAEVPQLREALRHYEEQLVQAHRHIQYLEQSRNEEAQNMQAEVRALQKILSEHTASVQNRQKGEQSLLRELEYTKAEQQNTLHILYEANQTNNNLKAEIARLSVQLSQAQHKIDETRSHLATAEEYILQLQHSHHVLPSDVQSQLRAARQENSRLVIDVATLRDDLNTARAQAEILMARAATADAEYDDMECRYRQTVESLSSRYDELLDQRNALTNKLSASPEASPAAEEAEALRASLEQLTAQVTESKHHLHTAETYIEENMQKWQEATALKEQHAQQQAFMADIHADLEATRRQNIELAQRIQDYEHAVTEAERLRQENEKLIIIIRQKDNATVSTSLKQIDEVQAALDKYVILHRQSEARVKELEQYLTRAENFIIQQEGKMGQSINNFEKDNSELKGQLSTAQDYIHSLQQAAEEERRLLVEAVQGRRAEKKRADGLLDALAKAEDYIAGFENKHH